MGKKSRGKAVAKRPPLRTNRSRWGWALAGSGAAFALAVVILSLFAPGLLGLGSRTAEAPFEKAPEAVLSTLTRDYRLSEQRGKVVVLFFSFPG